MRHKDLESQFVASQIASHDAELRRLDAQIAALQARKNAIEAIKKAISPLMGKQSKLQKRQKHASSVANGNGHAHPDSGASMTFSGTLVRTTSTGLREAIRTVLRDHPGGLKPAQVVTELGKRGELARYKGKVRPGTRVGNDLYSMKKAGQVSRRGGRYSLAQPESTNENT